jgi:hypothetical protein
VTKEEIDLYKLEGSVLAHALASRSFLVSLQGCAGPRTGDLFPGVWMVSGYGGLAFLLASFGNGVQAFVPCLFCSFIRSVLGVLAFPRLPGVSQGRPGSGLCFSWLQGSSGALGTLGQLLFSILFFSSFLRWPVLLCCRRLYVCFFSWFESALAEFVLY